MQDGNCDMAPELSAGTGRSVSVETQLFVVFGGYTQADIYIDHNSGRNIIQEEDLARVCGMGLLASVIMIQKCEVPDDDARVTARLCIVPLVSLSRLAQQQSLISFGARGQRHREVRSRPPIEVSNTGVISPETS